MAQYLGCILPTILPATEAGHMPRRFIVPAFSINAAAAGGIAALALIGSGCRGSELDGQPTGVAQQASAISPGVATLRSEQFAPATLSVDGHEIRVSGRRSPSATIVEIDPPDTVLIPGTPMLLRNGKVTGPVSSEHTATGSQNAFPSTPFGTPITIDLGSLALRQESSGPALKLAIGEALSRANGSEAFAISPADMLDGPRDLVLSGEIGQYSGRAWVGVVLNGNWEPANGEPQVFDQDGKQLQLAHVQVGYTKDASGTVQPGTTNIAAFVDDPSKLKTMTILLGKPSRLETDSHRVELLPEK